MANKLKTYKKDANGDTIRVTKYSQLWDVTKNTLVECLCPCCGKMHTARAESKRKRIETDFLLCKTCISKRTNIARYGVENPFQLEKVRTLVKNRDTAWYEKREQARCETCLKRYGVAHPAQRKETRAKQKQTMIEKYGVDNIFRNKEYIKTCCQKRFGRDNIFSGKDGIKLAEEGMLKKYGVRRALEKEEFKEKVKRTSLERYGVENYGITEEHTTRMQQTNLEKYGTKHAPSLNYIYNGISFDSSWELAFWIYCQDNNIAIERETKAFPYVYQDKTHYYIPDFLLNQEQFVEIKGDYFLDENQNLKKVFDGQDEDKIQAKNTCMKNNNIRIISSPEINKYLDYINETYGKNYLLQFKKNV